MIINDVKKAKIRKIINCFENGRVSADYVSLYIYRDGPARARQITLGFGITEYGNLKQLIKIYINDAGLYSDHFKKYVEKIGATPLVDNNEFKTLLVKASKEDPIMRSAQDKIYEEKYWSPALKFCKQNGFTQILSMAVILDSFVHSGSVLNFLRARFPTKVPSSGGDEREWISKYIAVRKYWLANHSNTILRNTIYRMECFEDIIEKQDWSLDKEVNANDIKIPA